MAPKPGDLENRSSNGRAPANRFANFSWVSTPWDVDHRHAEFGQSIEPPSLLVGHVALLLEPLQAGIVRVQLKWAVQNVRAEDLQSGDDG
jgi:hypothetical protein